MSVNPFKKKPLNNPPERVCLRLKKLRKEENKTIEEISQKTKIDKKYLLALEECRFKDLPKALIYQKNIIKAYVGALQVNPDSFLNQYLIEETVKKKCTDPQQRKNKSTQNWLCHLPDIIKYGALILVVIILISYLGWQVKKIVEPPNMIVYSPQEGLILTESRLTVHGEAELGSTVSINGQEISLDESGDFIQDIDLQPGVNAFVITAKKKHGKATTEVRNVVLKN